MKIIIPFDFEMNTLLQNILMRNLDYLWWKVMEKSDFA